MSNTKCPNLRPVRLGRRCACPQCTKHKERTLARTTDPLAVHPYCQPHEMLPEGDKHRSPRFAAMVRSNEGSVNDVYAVRVAWLKSSPLPIPLPKSL